MTDGGKREWACDNGECAAPDLENWEPGDGLELLIYMDQIGRYSRADARESLYDFVYRSEYDVEFWMNDYIFI